MKRRRPVDPDLPPERLWRFSYPDWKDEVSPEEQARYAHPTYAAFRRYRAACNEWAEQHGMTPAEMHRLVPRPVVVDRPQWRYREDGDDAA
ncbi:hypothetical protein [Actinoallomurus sp. NPDC052274]|uniref:hypothetical protein n=1 Tax=Actinoallomurus sp. NPDC052274 TaxID=3155420 RepID=UPI003440E7AB